jgi:His/Glu/Gln/Arg/opine family amino acid ABC transporter permease subunit
MDGFWTSLDFGVVWRFRYAFLNGLGITLFLSAVGLFGGVLLGGFIAIGTFAHSRWITVPLRGFVEFMRSTPLLMQAIWVQFALPALLGFSLIPIQSALLALTLNVGAYASEIIRAGIAGIGKGQLEAARALALPTPLVWTKVVLPQAFRIVLPPLTGMAISTIKASAILSILAINDLMRVATRINGFTFRPVELFTAAALIFFLVGLLVSQLGYWAERRWRVVSS